MSGIENVTLEDIYSFFANFNNSENGQRDARKRKDQEEPKSKFNISKTKQKSF